MAEDDTAQDESTLVDDLEAAFDAAEADDVETEAVEETETEEASDAEEITADTDDTPAAGDEDEGEEDSDEETVSLEPDEHWDEATKEAFGALPDDAKPLYRDKVRALDTAYDAKFQEVAAQRRELERYQEFDQLFAPYQQALDAAATTPTAYVKQLMAYAQGLQQDPAGTLRVLAEQAGVDLQSLAGPTEADEFADPAVLALKSQVNDLQSTINSNAQATLQAQNQQAQQEIAAFRDAVDEQGNPEHPHYDTVTPLMSSLLTSGQASTLEDAYQMATRAHPELGSKVIQAEVQKTLAKKQADTKKVVQKSKRAAKNAPVKKVAATDQPQDAGTHKEELERLYDELATQ